MRYSTAVFKQEEKKKTGMLALVYSAIVKYNAPHMTVLKI